MTDEELEATLDEIKVGAPEPPPLLHEMDVVMQPAPDAAARRDAEEAEAYARELETKLAKVEVLMSAGFAEYERRLAKVKAAFRRNMMQAHPAYTHEQFDKDYEELVGGKDE